MPPSAWAPLAWLGLSSSGICSLSEVMGTYMARGLMMAELM